MLVRISSVKLSDSTETRAQWRDDDIALSKGQQTFPGYATPQEPGLTQPFPYRPQIQMPLFGGYRRA